MLRIPQVVSFLFAILCDVLVLGALRLIGSPSDTISKMANS